jgi:hypothetical protein
MASVVALFLTLLAILAAAPAGGRATLEALRPPVVVYLNPLPSPTLSPTPSASSAPALPLPTAPPTNWKPQPAPPPAPPPPPPPPLLEGAASNVLEAVAHAYSEGIAPGRFDRVAVALYDRESGEFYGAGSIDARFRAASVVKVFIAARLLRAGRADGHALTDTDLSNMWKMITCSDSTAAETLWWQAGGPQGVITWAIKTYGLGNGIALSEIPGAWGTTWITARGMVNFYRAVAGDGAVRGWLFSAMASMHNCGFDQTFGLPAAAASWAVKQGWVCCWHDPAEPQTRLHSTGYVETFRYVAIILTEGRSSLYSGSGRSYVTAMARALLPSGHVPQPPPPSPSPSASPTPTPSGSPTPTPSQSPTPGPSETPSDTPSPTATPSDSTTPSSGPPSTPPSTESPTAPTG